MDANRKEFSEFQRLPSVPTKATAMSSSVESGLTVETIKLRPSHVALSRYDETMPFSAPNLESKLYRASSLIASKRLSSASSRCVGGNLHSQSTSQNSIFGRKTARMSAGDIGNSVNKMLPSRGDFGVSEVY